MVVRVLGAEGEKEMKKTPVIILFGGRSAEHEISLLSARNVLSALDRTRFEPMLVGIDKAGRWHRESERTLEAAAGDPRGVMLDANAPAVAMEEALVPRAAGAPDAVRVDDVVFPVCTGRSARTGPCRERWSWRASRTSAPACSAPPSGWTRTSRSACCATRESRWSTSGS
jgi:hypothetical protein